MENRIEHLSGSNTGTRLSNFELLRIVTMIIIVAHHFCVHGGFSYSIDSISLPRLWIQFMQMGGKVGVNVFILISGYFLIDSERLKISKVIKLWLQLLTYSLGLSIVLALLGLADFDLVDYIKMCFPVTLENWWFASVYFVMFLLSPFINKLLRALDKKAFQRLLITGFILWCLIPTMTNRTFQSNRLLWFIFVYSVAAYIRLWHNETSMPTYKYHLFTLAVVAAAFALTVVLDIVGMKYPAAAEYATHFYDVQFLQTAVIALGMFLGFKGLKMKYSNGINIISSATFGVYLLHDDYYIRPLLWRWIFAPPKYADSAFIIPYSIAVTLIVFFGCICVELLRIYVLEKNYMKLVYRLEPAIERWVEKFMAGKLIDKM